MTIGELQAKIGIPVVARTRTDYRRLARWWELEAIRGYPSSGKSREYAANMRWAAEMAGIHGPASWLELKKIAKEIER